MIDIVSLRNNVIDLATSGQISSDFICRDTVDDIIAELPPVSKKRRSLLEKTYEYAQEYEIPEHWRWVKLGEISSYGDTPKKAMPADVDKNTWILELEDIEAGGRLLKKERVSSSKSKGEKTIFRQGQVLYSKLRPYLKKILVADEDGISTPELISFDVYGGIQAQYIVLCLLNSYTNSVIDKRSYGIKMPRVDAGFMANLPIPLPPVSEQEFIVDKMIQVLSTISDIDDYQLRYTLDAENLKNKIMDAAFHGKLTEQLSTDGTAKDSIRQFCNKNSECEIEEGKSLFSIPKNWTWCRLSDISQTNIGLTYHPEDINHDGTIVIRSNNIVDGKLVFDDIVRVNASIRNKQYLNTNDIVICARNGSKELVGKCAIYQGDSGKVSFGAFMAVLRTPFYKYVYYYLQTKIFRRYFSGDDTKQINQVTQKILKNALIPLPPIAEQNRITDKIDAVIQLVQEA